MLLPPLRLLRFANPAVRRVLGSPAHRLLSGTLLVVEYRGSRSGRSFRVPLLYAETADGDLVAVAVEPERKRWWRSFAPSGKAMLVVRGLTIEAYGTLREGPAREAPIVAYVARYPRAAALVTDAAVVVFTRTPG